MKILSTLALMLTLISALPQLSFSQSEKSTPARKVVFQLATNDTTIQTQTMKQLYNLQKISPGIELEVVCHGLGLDMVVAEKSHVAEKLKDLSSKGVSFVACEFAMLQRNINKSQLIPGIGTVPSAIIEISDKQQMGWTYIKSGY